MSICHEHRERCRLEISKSFSTSRQSIDRCIQFRLQRGVSTIDQGRNFACQQRRRMCVQFWQHCPGGQSTRPDQPESYETMGSIHRRPGLKEDQGRGRPWKTCPHGNSIAIANLIIMHTHMIPASILSYPKVTISCRSLELALVYGYQKSHVYMLIFHASHRFRVICWHVYVWLTVF